MDVVSYLRSQGGLAHRSSLNAAGVSAEELRPMLESGSLVRVGRLRVALPDCDRALVDAAESGGALACVSAARHRGLWAMDDGRLHIAVPTPSSRLRRTRVDLVVHWDRTPIPTSNLTTLEPVVNMLTHVAKCQPFENAVAIADSAVNLELISHQELQRVAVTQGSLVQDVVAASDGRADSGLESIVRVRLASLGIAMAPQVVIDGHPVDGLIGERLVIQVDGFEWHSSPAQRRRDLEQDARLVLRGYTVLRFDYKQVVSGWDYVERTILMAIAQSLHRSRE